MHAGKTCDSFPRNLTEFDRQGYKTHFVHQFYKYLRHTVRESFAFATGRVLANDVLMYSSRIA